MATLVQTGPVAREDFEQNYDKVVREEIERFRARIEEYLAGTLTEDEFRAIRLRHGIYGQRQPGVQMIRTKFPGGMVTADQMDTLAEVSDKYAAGKGKLTTRQNLQYHFVPIARVPELMHELADGGLTTREACFNTVRNITACPMSGLARTEIFDVRPYAQKLAFALLRKELTDNLPRKFKIAFDGCATDCMEGAMHDVGLRAVTREENGVTRRGFRMVVGGGLGPLPVEAQLLDEFLPEEHLVARCEAVIRVFNKHGNRKNRNMARLKFVVRSRGWEWVREQIEEEFADIQANGGIATPEIVPEGFGGYQSTPRPLGQGDRLPVLAGGVSGSPQYDRWLESNVLEQKQPGYAVAIARTDQGNITSAHMRGVAAIARDAGDGLLRFDIDQNILLAWIPLRDLPRVHAALEAIGLGSPGAGEISDVISCPGAYSCNLALTKSMNLAEALTEVVRGTTDKQVRSLSVKISGCPNSCGQHWLADFGFYGNARKIGGKEIPFYQMLLGGGYDHEGVMRFGLAVQSIPARLAPEAVRRVIEHFISNRLPGERFRDYVLRFRVDTFKNLTNDLAKPAELFPEIYNDWGDDEAFSLQLGRGECAV